MLMEISENKNKIIKILKFKIKYFTFLKISLMSKFI